MRWPLMAEASGDGEASGTGAVAGDAGSGTGTGQGTQTQASGDTTTLLDWRTPLPENLRNVDIISRHKTLEAAAQTLVEQERALGRALFLPDRRSHPKDSDGYRAGLQKVQETLRAYDPELAPPEKADDYTWTLPEGRAIDEDLGGRWKAAFHKAGLTQGQAQEVMDEYFRTVSYAENVRAGQDERSRIEGMRDLDAEFGASTPQIMQRARSFWEHFGAGAFGGEAGAKAWEDMQAAVLPDGSRLMNKPHVIAALAEVGSRLGEGEYLDSTYYRAGANTLDSMQTRYNELQQKRMAGTLAGDEAREHTQLRDQLAAARDRAQQGGRRVA